MKHVLLFMLIAAVLAVAVITPNLQSPTGLVISQSINQTGEELPTFRTYTKAVCENISNFIVCHDELFANCGGFEYRLPDNRMANDIFNQGWKDPRNS